MLARTAGICKHARGQTISREQATSAHTGRRPLAATSAHTGRRAHTLGGTAMQTLARGWSGKHAAIGDGPRRKKKRIKQLGFWISFWVPSLPHVYSRHDRSNPSRKSRSRKTTLLQNKILFQRILFYQIMQRSLCIFLENPTNLFHYLSKVFRGITLYMHD